MNNCCDSFGNCQRGFGCPSGPAVVAKVGRQMPHTEAGTDDVPSHEFVDRFVEQQLAAQQEIEDAMGSTRMLGTLLIALALIGLSALAGFLIAAYLR